MYFVLMNLIQLYLGLDRFLLLYLQKMYNRKQHHQMNHLFLEHLNHLSHLFHLEYQILLFHQFHLVYQVLLFHQFHLVHLRDLDHQLYLGYLYHQILLFRHQYLVYLFGLFHLYHLIDLCHRRFLVFQFVPVYQMYLFHQFHLVFQFLPYLLLYLYLLVGLNLHLPIVSRIQQNLGLALKYLQFHQYHIQIVISGLIH